MGIGGAAVPRVAGLTGLAIKLVVKRNLPLLAAARMTNRELATDEHLEVPRELAAGFTPTIQPASCVQLFIFKV